MGNFSSLYSRKSTQSVLITFDAPADIIIDFHREGLGLFGITDVLDSRGCVREDSVAYSVLVGMFDADVCEVHDLLEMLIWLCAEEASPPPGFFGEPGEVKSLFENDLAAHYASILNKRS